MGKVVPCMNLVNITNQPGKKGTPIWCVNFTLQMCTKYYTVIFVKRIAQYLVKNLTPERGKSCTPPWNCKLYSVGTGVPFLHRRFVPCFRVLGNYFLLCSHMQNWVFFLCSLDNFLLKNVISFFFGNQI